MPRLSLQVSKECLNYLFINYYLEKLFVVHTFALGLTAGAELSIRNAKSHLNCN